MGRKRRLQLYSLVEQICPWHEFGSFTDITIACCEVMSVCRLDL
jgi:hypothetical protein